MVTDSLRRFRNRGNQAFIADCLGTLGILALLRGDMAEVRTYAEEVVSIGQRYGLLIALAEWQWLLGLVALYGGNALEARRLLEESLRVCLEVKNTFYLARVCMCLVETALWAGELAQAVQWLEQSLAYQAPPQDITITQQQRLWVAARLATAQGEYERAATLFGLADQVHSQIHHAIAGPMRALADAALATVRATLEPAVFAAAFAAGQQMALAEAFATLLVPAQVLLQGWEEA